MQNFKSIAKSSSIAISIVKFQKYCNILQYYWNQPCLGATPAVISLTIGTKASFFGVIDLVTVEKVLWRGQDFFLSFERISLTKCSPVDGKFKEKMSNGGKID